MRLLGVNIPDQKRIEVALTYVYGIGLTSSKKILKAAKINVNTRAKDISAEEANTIKNIIEKSYRIEGELRQVIRQNIERLKTLQAYRGTRHARRLPARGQRTKTNSRTIRGNVRKTAGSGRRKVDLK
ncbi:MAG: 30S ribosomal protein S13 [Patescibacteria group bacterium]